MLATSAGSALDRHFVSSFSSSSRARIGDVDTPEYRGLKKHDVFKNGKKELTDCLDLGIQYYSEDIINIIIKINTLLENYLFEYETIGEEETYFKTASKILPLLKDLLKMINKIEFYGIVDESIDSIDYKLLRLDLFKE